MGALDKYIDNINTIKADLEIVAAEILLRNSEKILDLLRDKQLGLGLAPDGKPLKWNQGQYSGDGTYTETTEWIASNERTVKPKVAGEPYNFQWSGSTFNSMFLNPDYEGSLFILTKNGKQKLLEGLYGNIFVLSENHNKYVNETILLPELYKYVLENLFI